MLKRSIVLCSLLLFMTAFSNIAFATAPYASIIAYNEDAENKSKLNTNTIGTLDIINMTPWNISFGDPSQNTQILKNMTETPFISAWLAGINGAGWKPGQHLDKNFAYHSIKVPLANLHNVWKLDNEVSGYGRSVYTSTAPIVFNSKDGKKNGNTVALNFMPTSSNGFYFNGMKSAGTSGPISTVYPATTLSFGDGTHNYGWQSGDTATTLYNSSLKKFFNVTHFLTIQALQGENNWKPITKNLVPVTAQKGKGGSKSGTTVQVPTYLTASGLVYPNFSNVAGGTGQSYDLVVILQAGDYVDMALLFLAVPSSNNAFLKP